MRAILARGFAVIFAATIVAAFYCILAGVQWEDVKSLLDVILPAETALLGSAVGFYFGAEK
jgi:hypothetical protein